MKSLQAALLLAAIAAAPILSAQPANLKAIPVFAGAKREPGPEANLLKILDADKAEGRDVKSIGGLVYSSSASAEGILAWYVKRLGAVSASKVKSSVRDAFEQAGTPGTSTQALYRTQPRTSFDTVSNGKGGGGASEASYKMKPPSDYGSAAFMKNMKAQFESRRAKFDGNFIDGATLEWELVEANGDLSVLSIEIIDCSDFRSGGYAQKSEIVFREITTLAPKAAKGGVMKREKASDRAAGGGHRSGPNPARRPSAFPRTRGPPIIRPSR